MSQGGWELFPTPQKKENMNTYKILFGGRGAEFYIHEITEEQRQKLIDLGIEDPKNNFDYEKIPEILGKEWTDTDEIYFGSYPGPEDYYITVLNDKGEEIWASDLGFYMNEGSEEDDLLFLDKNSHLMVEDYVKGTFKEYILDTEEEFNPELLEFKSVEINESFQVFTDLKYDGKDLELDEFGDTRSNGTYFHIP